MRCSRTHPIRVGRVGFRAVEADIPSRGSTTEWWGASSGPVRAPIGGLLPGLGRLAADDEPASFAAAQARPCQFARCLGVIRNTSDQLKGHAITPPPRRWKLLIGCAQSGWPNLDSRSYASCALHLRSSEAAFFSGNFRPAVGTRRYRKLRVELPCGRGAALGRSTFAGVHRMSDGPILPPNPRWSYRGLISVELWTLAAHPGLSGRQPAGAGRARPRSRE